MLTLSLFAACDKVLLDPIAQQLTLVGISSNINALGEVEHPEGESSDIAQSKFALPPMSVATFWIADEEDKNKKFEQKIQIVAADGKKTDVGEGVKFTISRDFHRTVQPIQIACRKEGTYCFELYLREDGSEWGDCFGRFNFRAMSPQDTKMKVKIEPDQKRIDV